MKEKSWNEDLVRALRHAAQLDADGRVPIETWGSLLADAADSITDLLAYVELVMPVVEAAKRIDQLLEARCRPHDPAANQRAVERADAEFHEAVKRLKERETREEPA